MEGQPKATDCRYCVWDRIAKRHLYTSAWIQNLATDWTDAGVFAMVRGHPPRQATTAGLMRRTPGPGPRRGRGVVVHAMRAREKLLQ